MYFFPWKKQIIDSLDQPVLLNPFLSQGYRLAICDSSVSLPTVLTPELVRRASTFSSLDYNLRAKSLFDYLLTKVSYGNNKRNAGYSSAMEVWENKQGVCGEMTYLYVSMARFAGLKSNYVSVVQDNSGKNVHHACALVHQNRPLLVDLAYKKYDIIHKKWSAITDERAWESFKSWRQ